MGKDFKRRFTVSLDIDTKDAEKQIKSTVGNLKTILADLGSASDKMTYFKELADYLSQVDTQLDSLRQKYGEGIFNQMFGGLDENLRKQMETTFGVAREQLSQLEQLKEKVAAAKNNGITTGADLKPLEQEVRSLYESIGMLDKLDLSGKGKVETRIKKLEAALNGFAVVWDDVNDKIKQGFNFGQQSSSGGFDDKVKKEIEKLESQAAKYQSILDKINEASAMVQASDSGKSITLGFKVTEEEARKLVNRLQELDDEAKNLDKSSAKYAENLAERAKIAVQLREMEIKLTKTNKYSEVTKQAPDFLKDALRSLGNSALNDFVNQSKNVLSIVSSGIDEIKNKIAQIKNVGASGGQSDLNDELALSYDKLKEKVQEYYALLDERSNNPTKERKAEIQALQGEIQDEISGLVDESQQGVILDIFDEIDGKTIKIEEAISEFANALGIIPDKFQKISKSASDAEKPVQSIMYHLGNLLNGSGARDTFDQMPYNLTEAANGTRYEKYGFGALGGGLFGVTNPATIDQVPGGSRFIQSIDISKYNMYMADTEERATNLIDFLSKLQKFSIKQAEPNYTGFDKQLEGVNIDSLYQQFKVLFEQSDLTKEKLQEFISEMVNLLQQAGLYFDKDTNILDFSSIGNLQGTDNISTRFMKMLGYQGVNVGTTSLDGLGQGSVLFNFDKSDIVGYFNTIEQAVKDYENLANQIDGNEWTGSIEQLQQYKQNVDDIINRLQQFKSTDIGMAQSESIEKTINRLEQVKTTIDKTISGNGQSSFVAITNSIDQAEAKVREFLALADEIQNKSFDNAWDATDNVEIGKYIERLNIAKAALDELGNQGRLTAEQLEQVNNAFDQATGVLSSRTKTYDAYASGSSSTYDYYDEYERERDKADQLEQENESLREQLSKKQQTTEEYTNAENASLERKLELLSDIADQYANNITQRDRNRYEQLNYKDAESGLTSKEEDRYFELGEKIDEADEQLQQFGETYDKILLKLANGKTIEILPDDAGLRKLYKIANEFYQGEYDGIEIEDVVFMRKQEQAVIEQNNQELERQLDIQKQIATAQKETPESQQAETIANNTKAITSWEELCQVVERYNELCRNSFTEGQSLTDVEGTEKSRIENRFMATKGVLDDPDKFVDYMISMERMAGIMGEYDVNRLAEYFGIEIPQAAAKATEAIQEVTQATDGSSTPPDTSVTTAKYEVETQVVKQQNDELERNQQLKAQEGTLDANSSIIGDMSQELNQLDELHAKLIVVKEAIDAKTKAFEEEYVTVDAAIDAEVQSLQLLLEKLQEVLNKINLVSESFTKANAEIAELKGTKEVDVKENITSETIVNKAKGIVSQDYALDTTLLKTNGILNQILAAIGNNESLAKMVEPLNAAVAELKNVANGIVEHQKAQRTDLTDSSARIANNYGQLSSITGNAVAGLGGEVQIENMKALADNIVRVRGAVQNADGVWKGFVVDIDESNKAVIRAVDEQSVFAKSLNEAAQAAKKVGEEAKQTGNDSFTKSLTEQTNVFNKYRENLKDVSYISDDLKDKLDNLGTSLHQVTDTAGLNAWKNSFSDIQKEVTLAENTFIAQQTGRVNQAQKALKDAFKKSGLKEEDTNLTDEQQKIVDGYMQAKAAFEAYNKLAQKGNQIELSTLQNVTNELYQQIEAYKQKNNIVDGSKKTYGDNAIVTAKGKYKSLSQVVKNEYADSTVIQDALNQYTAAYQILIDKQKEYKAGQELNTDQKAEFKQLQMECNKYATELNKLITANKKFEESAQNVTKVDEDFVDTAEGRMKALQDFVQVQYGATAEIGKFDAACEKLTFTVDNGNGTFTQMTAAINPARNAIGAMVGDIKEATSAFGQFFNELKGKVRSIFMYLASSMSLQEVWQQLRQGVNYVREIDSALTELKKVTDETDATYEKFLQTASKTASVIGSTVSDFTNATADFARLGYNLEQATSLAEAASVYKNVGDGIDDISQASESIISTMKAFGIEAENAMGIVDRFNEIGNNFAISSTGIGEAMQRSASALYEAGNTIDESVALITAANSVVDFTPRRYSNITA